VIQMLPRALRFLASARGTVLLLSVLAFLLLLNVALPQRSVVGDEALTVMVDGRPMLRFLLIDLGLSEMPTSPVFLIVLGLFFVNLAQVLISRVGPTWRRCTFRARSEKGLAAWAALPEANRGTRPTGFDTGFVVRTLRGFGFQVRRAGDTTFLGVKHRLAPLGFLVFHVSFFLLLGGGILIYYTRFVGSAILSEGQEFTGQYMAVERQPRLGGPPDLRFSVSEVEPLFEDGNPIHLGAVLRFSTASGTVQRRVRVNDPAEWGHASVLVNQAGLAPVLWLQDARGYTVDRIVTPMRTRGGEPTEMSLDGGKTIVTMHPLVKGSEFPTRDELTTTPLRMEVHREGESVFDGELTAGAAADLGDGRLVLEDVRYWVGVRVVAERGGWLLITGFVLGILGLIWRLLLFRREVVLTWDDESFRLVGRGEYFSDRFEDEQTALFETLERGPVVTPAVAEQQEE